jgi:nicotinamide-nucleotide amidase
MRAALLAVGSELLGSDRLDTNALVLARYLERHGATVTRKVILGDDETALAEEVGRLVASFDVILIGGGLGPTADDVTREAVARALGRPLERRPEAVAALEARFRAYGIAMPASNLQQADLIAGGVFLDNPLGSAPGQRVDVTRGDGAATVFLFPGVPRELDGMAQAHLVPWLASHSDGRVLETWTLKVACLPESTVDEMVRPAYEEFGRENITILAAVGETRLRFAATGDAATRRAWLAKVASRLRDLVGRAVFAEGDDTLLEAVVGDLLRSQGAWVATAESCTGGLVAERLTRVAGSSDYVLGGVVAYANAVKVRELAVPAELIDAHGAVSAEVARAMATGVRARFGATFGIGITGVAGPGGGTPEKPVGTVHLALAGPPTATRSAVEEAVGGALPPGYGGAGHRQLTSDGTLVEHRQIRVPGERDRIRQLASQLALEMLRRRLLLTAPETAA